MRPPRLALRPLQNTLLGSNTCVWCHTRQYLERPTRRTATWKPKAPVTRNKEYADRRRQWENIKDPGHRERQKADAAQRDAIYLRKALESASSGGVIQISTDDAQRMVSDYSKCDLQTLMDTYDYPLEAHSTLARFLLRISVSSCQRAGVRLMAECSRAGDPYALLCIGGSLLDANPKNWVNNLSSEDVRITRSGLEALAYKESNPDAMVLEGLALRRKGKDAAARKLFEGAMKEVIGGDIPDFNSATWGKRTVFKIPWVADPLPIPTPWIALGTLLLEQAMPDLDAAMAVFRIGAEDADDPVACFHYAECVDSYSDEWLKFMTKAAASGHPMAMCHLGNFYIHDRRELNRMVGPVGRHQLRQLDVFTQWKPISFSANELPGLPESTEEAPQFRGREAMAFEWLYLGFTMNHKGSCLALARLLHGKGLWWAATKALGKVLIVQNNLEEDDDALKRDAYALTKLWMLEERAEGVTFTSDMLADIAKRKSA